MNEKDIDLNAPAFIEENEEEESQEEVKVEEKVSPSPEKEAVVEETKKPEVGRIPYSRFETVNEAKIKAETELEILRQQLAEKAETNQTQDIPQEWIDLYGDSEQSKKAWEIQKNLVKNWQEEATQKAIEKIELSKKEQEEIVEKNLEEIDNSLEEFQSTLGRKLTEEEENAILDIQDEWTPKDEKGNYIAPLISPEKAWEVYTLRNKTATATKSQARRRVVSITSQGSESSDNSSNDWEQWRPGDTQLWKKSL